MLARSAVEWLKFLDAKEVSAQELLALLHERADQTEGKVNAFALEFRDSAKRRAKQADEARARGEIWGPLHGLPISIKESIDVKGTPSTIGLKARKEVRAPQDAVVVKLLREAGAIILGKTNVPQTLLAPMESANAVYGTTKNPWKLSHGPGGSSGGEAAALAAGSSIVGVGGDIGGSIRTPASFCGVVGLKPTRYLWSTVGSNGILPGQETVKAVLGPMARHVEDLSLLMKVVEPRKHAVRDPAVPPLSFQDPSEVDVSQLTIGFYEDDGFFRPAKSVQRAVQIAAETLDAAGARTRHFAPPNVEEIVYLYFSALSADGTKVAQQALEGESFHPMLKSLARVGKMPRPALKSLARVMRAAREKRVAALLESLGEKSVPEYWKIAARRDEIILDERRTWKDAGIDVLIAPVYVTPAAPIGMGHDFTMGFVNVARYSFLNMPAGTVPITRVEQGETRRGNAHDRFDKRAKQIESHSLGLPVGVQVIGRAWQEHKVLAVMRYLENKLREMKAYPRTPVDPE